MEEKISELANQVRIAEKLFAGIGSQIESKIEAHNQAVDQAVRSHADAISELHSVGSKVSGEVVHGSQEVSAALITGRKRRDTRAELLVLAIRQLIDLAVSREELLFTAEAAAVKCHAKLVAEHPIVEDRIRQSLDDCGYSVAGYSEIGVNRHSDVVEAMIRNAPKLRGFNARVLEAFHRARNLSQAVRQIHDGNDDVKNRLAIELQNFVDQIAA